MYQPYNPYQLQNQFQNQNQYQFQPQTVQPTLPSQPTIAGRIVKSIEEIVPNEVPMNGSVGIFPLADMSSIFVKGWNQDGTISTITYKAVVEPEKPEEPTVSLVDIMDSLNDIQSLLKADKPATTRKATTRKKADDDASD